MRRAVGVLVSLLFAATLWATAHPALASTRAGVISGGSCTMGSAWVIELNEQGDEIEVTFGLVTGEEGQVWKVLMRHNGEEFFRGRRVTEEPDGSFEIERSVPDTVGNDLVVALARNPETGERCRASALLPEDDGPGR